MCLSILWGRTPRACRNTHALPDSVQGHKHFQFFLWRNPICPCLLSRDTAMHPAWISSQGRDCWMCGWMDRWADGQTDHHTLVRQQLKVSDFPLAADSFPGAAGGCLGSGFVSVIPAKLCSQTISHQLCIIWSHAKSCF